MTSTVSSVMPTLKELAERRDKLKRVIKDHYAYYERWRDWNSWFWNVSQLFIILSGALTSLAATYANKSGYVLAAATVLPLLASLAGTLQLQFRFKETWRLREDGRIKTQGLEIEIDQLSLSDFAKAEERINDITKRLIALSEVQGNAFFALIDKSVDDKASGKQAAQGS